MKRLLLIAYHFPPEPSAGALRPSYLARTLPELGWEVVVVTKARGPSGPVFRVVHAPVLGEALEGAVRRGLDGESAVAPAGSPLRRFLRRVKAVLFFPDHLAGWIPPATASALAFARRERVDAVMSTAMPASSHVVAAIVALVTGLAWVADYRDPWTGNAYAGRGPVRGFLERWFERLLLLRAAAITTVTEPIAYGLRALHHRSVAVIPNAVDTAISPIPAEPRAFELCYTGSMYDGQQTPALLFSALARLKELGEPAGAARVVFYGPNSSHVVKLAAAFGLRGQVEQRGPVPREVALREQRLASDLLVFMKMDERIAQQIPSKILEYVQIRRPVLAFGPQGALLRTWLARNRIGWFASDEAEALEAVRAAYRRYAAGNHEIEPPKMFDVHDLGAAFAAELDAAITTRAPGRSRLARRDYRESP